MKPADLDRQTWRRLKSTLERGAASNATLQIAALDVCLLLLAWTMASEPRLGARALAVLPTALTLLHAYLLHHECVHRAVFRADRLNRALGHLLGFILVYPFATRRRAHLLHHTWTGDSLGDPTNRRARERLMALPARARRVLDVLWRGWFPFLALNERIGLWRDALSGRAEERSAGLIYLSLYAVMLPLFGLLPALQPLLLTYLAALALVIWLEELINLPHHLDAPLSQRGQPLPLWQQHAYSASCRSVPVWSRWLLLHFNLHVAHHLFPQLPWHVLPRVQSELAKLGLDGALGHELDWNWKQRRRPFADVFAAYFERTAPRAKGNEMTTP